MRHTIAISLLLLAPSLALADDAADPMLAEMGRPVYVRYCGACHGPDGQGGGPSAAALRTPPADLTRIAARRNGTFPDGEIARFIDGRFDVASHGSREMPVWGERFSSDVPDSGVGESVARGRISTLIEYLKSIQVPGE
jgi:mono/diheme cytochrome c family protein